MTDFLNRRDIAFNLHELHALDEVLGYPRYQQHDRASCDAIIEAAHTLASEHFYPHATKSDAKEPHFDGATVHIIPEVKAALNAYVEAGFLSASFDTEYGGLQLPVLVSTVLGFVFSAANVGTAGYPFLTGAAANLVRAHGSAAQRERFMLPMLAGRWFGTMCLSEPTAGSSLADIKTRASQRADGRYNIVGNKMWISGGEHELTENIVHLVLAKIEGAPAGVKGISLFIVPKKQVNADGSVGAGNGVRLIGLNHKMGYRGTTNAALAFGDGEDCIGEIVGEPHKGLAYMFHMMNEARISVGIGATAIGTAGYRYAIEYTRSRPQGRSLSNKDPASAPLPIIAHADVRRMLLQQKAYVEGALSLGLYCARLVDEQQAHPDATRRQQAHTLLEVLTPIVKAWPSDYCLKANELALQCLGGYGYTRDYPVERLYRDNRLNPIHEGTNGIQGLDLLGRKVLGDGGAGMKAVFAQMQQTITQAQSRPGLAQSAADLAAAMQRIVAVTTTLGMAAAKGQVELAFAHTDTYLQLFGHTVLAWIWLKAALVAEAALPAAIGESERAFYGGKFAACHFFYLYELPKTAAWADLLAKLDGAVLTLDIEGL